MTAIAVRRPGRIQTRGREELRASYVGRMRRRPQPHSRLHGPRLQGPDLSGDDAAGDDVVSVRAASRGISNVSYCWKQNGNFQPCSRCRPLAGIDLSGREYPDRRSDDARALDASLQVIVPRPQPYEIAEQRLLPGCTCAWSNTYRVGRMMLAGDAAQLSNTPAGGMGLNGGIHDAFELAAALIDVLRHGAPDDRLDAYDRRRRPIAREDILAQADRNRARMRERDPERRLATFARVAEHRRRPRQVAWLPAALVHAGRAGAERRALPDDERARQPRSQKPPAPWMVSSWLSVSRLKCSQPSSTNVLYPAAPSPRKYGIPLIVFQRFTAQLRPGKDSCALVVKRGDKRDAAVFPNPAPRGEPRASVNRHAPCGCRGRAQSALRMLSDASYGPVATPS